MTKRKAYKTDFLFVTPSFLMGMGSILNVAGRYFPFNYSTSDVEADMRALESDWGVVSQDICAASKDFETTCKKNNTLING